MHALTAILKTHPAFHPVVPFAPGSGLLPMDFTNNNKELTGECLNDTACFSQYILQQLSAAGAVYGIGGYNEDRMLYRRSPLFDGAEPRTVHLGIDIWGRPHTKVMAPLDGIVHSFAFNNAFGDYGATIILTHRLHNISFHTLYGHLSLASLGNLYEGALIKEGDVFASFGLPFENGQWPPHLHFQIVIDMQGKKGDYPGVCRQTERVEFLKNCPDPDLILRMMPAGAIN